MKQKKWLFRAASGMVATILLTLPAYAAEPNITITDNAPSGSINQLQPEAEKAPVPNQKGTTTPYPIDIQLSEQSGRSFLYKTYTVAADYAPDQLVEDPFSQGGYPLSLLGDHPAGVCSRPYRKAGIPDQIGGERHR